MPDRQDRERQRTSPGEVGSIIDLPVQEAGDVPAEARRMVEQQIRASAEREIRLERERAAAFREAGEEMRKELRALMGEDGYDEYRALIREGKRRRGASLMSRAKLALSAGERQRLRQQQQRRLAAFLRARRVTGKQLAAVDARMAKRLAKLFPREPERKSRGPIPEGQVPRQVLASRGDRRLDPTPPYDTLGFWDSWYAEGEFTVSGFHWGYDKKIGTLGNTTQLDIWDADNWDYATETLRTLFGFWTQVPPNATSLRIWVNAELVKGWFFQHMTPEWYGTSHAFFRSENSLFSEVIGVVEGQSYQERTQRRTWQAGSMLHPVKLDHTWDSGAIAVPAQWYLLEHSALPKRVPPPSGTSLWCWVGSECQTTMWVDDENGLGNANFKWRFNSIVPQVVT